VVKFSRQERQIHKTEGDIVPGPQSYKQTEYIGNSGPKYYIPKAGLKYKPNMTTSMAWPKPGPGAYDTHSAAFRSSGLVTAPKAVIGKQKRDTFGGRAVPGPNHYTINHDLSMESAPRTKFGTEGRLTPTHLSRSGGKRHS